MAGDIIRFPGRPRITSDRQEANTSAGKDHVEQNDVSAVLRGCISDRLAGLPDGLSIRELVDPQIGVSSLEKAHQASIIGDLLDALIVVLTQQSAGASELQVRASTVYQPELLAKSYRGLASGHYALLLFDAAGEPGFGSAFELAEVLRARVAAAGGQLDLSQQLDDGLSIALHLPLQEAGESQTSAHVLLVDDSEAVQSSVRDMLESLGYQVTVRAGGLEALDAIRRKPADFDLVISDVTMPRLGGVEMVTRLRAIRTDLPVVLMTGFTIDSAADRALDVKAVLRKPFTLAELRRTVTLALDKSSL